MSNSGTYANTWHKRNYLFLIDEGSKKYEGSGKQTKFCINLININLFYKFINTNRVLMLI